MFTQKKAAAEIARYRQKGARPTTRLLRDGRRSTPGWSADVFVKGSGA